MMRFSSTSILLDVRRARAFFPLRVRVLSFVVTRRPDAPNSPRLVAACEEITRLLLFVLASLLNAVILAQRLYDVPANKRAVFPFDEKRKKNVLCTCSLFINGYISRVFV